MSRQHVSRSNSILVAKETRERETKEKKKIIKKKKEEEKNRKDESAYFCYVGGCAVRTKTNS